MSMPHSSILKAFRRRWRSSAALVRLVPGGLHHEDDEAGEGGMVPNARIQIRHEAPEYNSGTTYTQQFRVSLTVWSAAGPVDAGEIEGAIQALFPRSAASSLTLDSGRVLNVRRADGDLTQDQERKEGRGVLVTSLGWDVLIQGTE